MYTSILVNACERVWFLCTTRALKVAKSIQTTVRVCHQLGIGGVLSRKEKMGGVKVTRVHVDRSIDAGLAT